MILSKVIRPQSSGFRILWEQNTAHVFIVLFDFMYNIAVEWGITFITLFWVNDRIIKIPPDVY